MDTLTSFKKELKNYRAMTMTNCSFASPKLNVEREIGPINTVGFTLKTVQKDATIKLSYMDWPKASGYNFNPRDNTILLSYDNDYFVYKLTK